ncbi:MAG: hypothetical protein KZQ77_05620 [Candidatus Thiodiazotropha sp. (ex Notomyrtea botanica)]|nr:hypothetical protein [Candidatus Thiodiazotropha sp. (ex Notomyrtea botanica)]
MKAMFFTAQPQKAGGYELYGEDLETGEVQHYGYFSNWKLTEKAIHAILGIPQKAA